MIFICGPTSSGKTSLAIKLCKKYNGEIISADSRQIYREMDIGTGKLPITNQYSVGKHDDCWIINGVRIWAYDIVTPGEYFSVLDYKEYAEKRIEKIEAQEKKVFVVGGTGLYIDALLGYINGNLTEPDFELRKELNKLSVEELQKKLPKVTLEKMNNSDINNPRRLIRKIENGMNPVEDSNKESQIVNEIQDTNIILLGSSRDVLYGRVDNWVDEIWDKLVEETKFLISKGYEETPQMQGLIYKTAFIYVKHKMEKDEAIERIKFDLHAYIRRQETWFKKYKNAKNIDIVSDTFDTECLRLVELISNE